MTSRILLKYFTIILFFSFALAKIAKSEPVENGALKDSSKKEEGFNPGKLIFEHIGDSYEWHIATIGEHHISIPLLGVVYSNEKGLVVFSISHFHHGELEYEGFRIAKEGEKFAGKIIEKKQDGNWSRPVLDLSITKNINH